MALLKDKSYFATGGSCDLYGEPESVEELSELLKEIDSKQIPYFVLGAGSNSLVMDAHWSGAVIKLDRIQHLQRLDSSTISVGAGVENSELVRWTRAQGLFGLEWMYRLPGQIGGTARMNARCYGGGNQQLCSIC